MNLSAVRGRGRMQVVLQRLIWAALFLTALLFFSSFNTNISISSCSRPSQIPQHPVIQHSCQSNIDPIKKQNQLKKLWSSKSWNAKVDAMSALFKDALSDAAVLSQQSKAMCISAGIGQEVMALRQLGVEGAIGIEVVESPPLVIRGDGHKHPFADCTFDLEFSAHLAEALFPWRFVAEIERTLKPGGAVMYLFRGDFGCELYTGDFRWEVDSLNSNTGKDQLRHALGGAKVDHLHLDNTFCNPRFEFPPRHITTQKVLDIISLYPEHNIVIGIDTLGKEELLVDIARTLKTKIFVRPERLQTMHLLGLPDIFTVDTSVTRVRAVPRYSLTIETLDVLNSMHPTIGILPTGSFLLFRTLSAEGSYHENFHQNNASSHIKVSFNSRLGGETAKTNMRLIERNLASKNCVNLVSGKMYLVPYSLHCCFSELQYFVELIKPSHITGILASSTCEINPNIYFNHLCKGKQLCMQDEVDHSTQFMSVKRDIGRRVNYHGSKSEGFLKVSCKPENNTIKNKSVCRRRLRKFLMIYTNKINRCRRKRCGAKLYHWDSDKEDAVEDSLRNGN